jgi:hypothetical protein
MIREGEMGVGRSTCEEKEGCTQSIGGQTGRKGHLDELKVDGKITFK